MFSDGSIHEEFYGPSPKVVFDICDPIDFVLFETIEQATGEQLPTEVSQRNLIKHLSDRDPTPAEKFILRTHRGIIAIVAHTFKGQGTESDELLELGEKAFMQASRQYDGNEVPFNFLDDAVEAIETALAAQVPRSVKQFIRDDRGSPMDKVLTYSTSLSALIETVRNEQIIYAAKNKMILQDFSSTTAQKVLPLLNLPRKSIAKRTGLVEGTVNNVITECMHEAHTISATALALELLDRGVHFNVPIPSKPLVEILTDQEIRIASNLHLMNGEIAKITGITTHEVATKLSYIAIKLRSRHRVETALMMRICEMGERQFGRLSKLSADLGLVAVKRNQMEQWLNYDGIDPEDRAIIRAYYLSEEQLTWEKVGQAHNMPAGTARSKARRAKNCLRLFIPIEFFDTTHVE